MTALDAIVFTVGGAVAGWLFTWAYFARQHERAGELRGRRRSDAPAFVPAAAKSPPAAKPRRRGR